MYLELKEDRSQVTREQPFCCYHNYNMTYPFQIPVHWHPEIEILYVIRGPLKVIIEGEEYTGEQGDVFCVNPGELHFMDPATTDIDYYALLFPLELLSFQLEDSLDKEFFQPIRDHSRILPHHPSTQGNASVLRYLFTQVVRAEHDANTLSKQLTVRILLLSLLREFAVSGLQTPPASRGNDPLQRELLTYLQQKYMEPLRLEDLSKQFHLSEKYLSRYFKQHFHLTLTQYLMHLRLTHARHLLESSNLPVTEVALQSGFSNVSHFIRSFHTAFQMSPLQYRKSYSRESIALLPSSRHPMMP